MKRFHLFAGDDYYPAGGARDLRGSFDSVWDAVEHMANKPADWWHVLDSQTGQIVKESHP